MDNLNDHIQREKRVEAPEFHPLDEIENDDSRRLRKLENQVSNLEKALRRLQRSLQTVKKPDIVRERNRPHLIDIYIDDCPIGSIEYDPSKTKEEILNGILASDFVAEHLKTYPLIEATLEYDLSFASISCHDIRPKNDEGRFLIREGEVK